MSKSTALIASGKMNFTEATKRDAEEKFQQLDAGTAPSPITPPELDSFSQFEQKSKKFHDRIASQDMEVKRAFDTITANKNKRLAAEAAERKRKEDEKQRRRWAREDLIKKIVIISLIAIGAIGIILGAIFGIRAIVKGVEAQEYARYSEENFVISIEDKVAATENSSYYDGYIMAFEVKIKNNSILDVIQIQGEMNVYNAEDKLLVASTCTFSGDLTAGEESTFTLNIDRRQSDEVIEFYYADYDDLRVTFKLTEVIYEGYESREYNGDPVTILALSVGSDGISTTEKTYQEALSLYNQGKYAEALPKFQGLGYYKESLKYYSECLEKVEEAETESAYQSAITLMKNEKYARDVRHKSRTDGNSIPCGALDDVIDEEIEHFRLPKAITGEGEFFLLRARGESMIKAGIDDGDLVLIRKQETAKQGNIVAFLYDNEQTTLKRYKPTDDAIYLCPENDSMQPIVLRGEDSQACRRLASGRRSAPRMRTCNCAYGTIKFSSRVTSTNRKRRHLPPFFYWSR